MKRLLDQIWDRTLEWDKESDLLIAYYEDRRPIDGPSLELHTKLTKANEKSALARELRSLMYATDYRR